MGYIEAELDLKDDHIKESKLFVTVPEIHPDFEPKYKKFSERYEKQYPGRMDSRHKEERWQEFWKMVITGMQETKWKEKLDTLKKEHGMDGSEKKGKEDAKPSSTKRKGSDLREESDRDRKSFKTDNGKKDRNNRSVSPDRSSSGRYRRDKASRSSSDKRETSDRRSTKDRGSQIKSARYLDKFPVHDTLNAIEEVCHLLGVLSPALKIVVDGIRNSGVDSKESVNILLENDNALLIEMAFKRFEALAKTAPRGPGREKLIKAAAHTKKLQEYASLKLQEIAIAASDNAISARKTPPASSSNKSLESYALHKRADESSRSIPSNETVDLICGLDVNKIARATYERGTEAVIEFIKNAFAYEGVINPKAIDINEVYKRVSRIHFQMSLSGVSSDAEGNRMSSDLAFQFRENTDDPAQYRSNDDYGTQYYQQGSPPPRDFGNPQFPFNTSQRKETSQFPSKSSLGGEDRAQAFLTGLLAKAHSSGRDNRSFSGGNTFSGDSSYQSEANTSYPSISGGENAGPSFQSENPFRPNRSPVGRGYQSQLELQQSRDIGNDTLRNLRNKSESPFQGSIENILNNLKKDKERRNQMEDEEDDEHRAKFMDKSINSIMRGSDRLPLPNTKDAQQQYEEEAPRNFAGYRNFDNRHFEGQSGLLSQLDRGEQRNFGREEDRYEMNVGHSSTNNQYFGTPWNRGAGEYDENSQGNFRNMGGGFREDSEMGMGDMRNRDDDYRPPPNQLPRPGQEEEWGQGRNWPDPYFDHSNKMDDSGNVNTQAFQNQYR